VLDNSFDSHDESMSGSDVGGSNNMNHRSSVYDFSSASLNNGGGNFSNSALNTLGSSMSSEDEFVNH